MDKRSPSVLERTCGQSQRGRTNKNSPGWKEGQQPRDLGADRRRGGKKAGRPLPLRREACVEEQAISL